jgi:UDP-N-acetylmuramoyl-tripeptide--D-alanyl-D-alanine ligase
MPALSLDEIVQATGGTLLRGDGETRVDSFDIDTRRMRSGGLFFALKGSRADGHDYLAAASRAGAAAAIVEREPDGKIEGPAALIRVDDAVAALSAGGALARKKCGGAKFIALTGSVGKTTTKNLISAGLGSTRRVHSTEGNRNNHLGVPLTLLACPEDAEFAVVELGMNAPGEIAHLARLTQPDIGLVTAIRPAHFENFDSLDDIAAAKGELYAVLAREGTSVVNLDDHNARLQAARHAGPRVTFGRSGSADIVLQSVNDRLIPGAELTFRYGDRTRSLQLRLAGAHNAWNAVAALATVAAAGEDIDAAADAMGRVEPTPGRCKIHQLDAGVVVVDDSYNSSPNALAAVLRTLQHSQTSGRKIVVMGDMLELGSRETQFHREAGRRVAQIGVDILVGVGPRSRAALDVARKSGVPETRHEKDARSAAETLPGLVRPGDLLLIKGSRAMQLEIVVEALLRVSVESR